MTVTLCPMPFYVILFVTESIFLWPNVSIAGEWSGIIIIARKLSRRCGETPSSGESSQGDALLKKGGGRTGHVSVSECD